MSPGVPAFLMITGLVLFAVGDLLWLLRNTFKRPMSLRLTGGLVAAGVVLMSAGLLAFVVRG